MKAVAFLVLVTSTAILAQSKIGEQCGLNNEGRVIPMADCKTNVIIMNTIKISYHAIPTNNPVCCIEDYYERCGTTKSKLRKSVEACADFGAVTPKIVGTLPTNVVQPGEYPYNAMFGFVKDPATGEIEWGVCGGVLISEYFVLTVAHCINNVMRKVPVMIRLGSLDLSGRNDQVIPQDIPIAELIPHPRYKRVRQINDIGLVRLAEAVKFTDNIQAACLHTGTDIPENMISTGWGMLDSRDGYFNNELRKTAVTTLDFEACNKTYRLPRLHRVHQFCTFTDSDVCYLNSGSPIFVLNKDGRATVVGLAAYGKFCSNVTPTIDIRVSSYLDWIEEIVWP